MQSQGLYSQNLLILVTCQWGYKLECLSLANLYSLVSCNPIAYWAHSCITKKMKCCEYNTRLIAFPDSGRHWPLIQRRRRRCSLPLSTSSRRPEGCWRTLRREGDDRRAETPTNFMTYGVGIHRTTYELITMERLGFCLTGWCTLERN